MIFRELGFEMYKALRGINNSALKHFDRSPAHGKVYLDEGQEETDAMRMGHIIHQQILEPSKVAFDHVYVRKPDNANYTQTVWKEWRAEQEKLGKQILTGEKFDLVKGVTSKIARHPYASRLLAQGDSEISMTAKINGVECKARLDHVVSNTIADIKTMEDCRLRPFLREVTDRTYYRQLAFYMDIANVNGFEIECAVIVAVEKCPPYEIICYQLPANAIARGRAEYQHLLSIYKECLKNNSYPGYNDGLVKLAMPGWFDSLPMLGAPRMKGIEPSEEVDYLAIAFPDRDLDNPLG